MNLTRLWIDSSKGSMGVSPDIVRTYQHLNVIYGCILFATPRRWATTLAFTQTHQQHANVVKLSEKKKAMQQLIESHLASHKTLSTIASS
jgi:hypothetical protein